jgi:transposase-like protein
MSPRGFTEPAETRDAPAPALRAPGRGGRIGARGRVRAPRMGWRVMGRNRTYSDEERAQYLAVLAANGGNVHRTSLQTGIPERTLTHWASGTAKHAANLAESKKLELRQELLRIAGILAGAIPGKVGRANLKDTSVALGIVMDKVSNLPPEPPAEEHPPPDGQSYPALLTDEEMSRRERESDRAAATGGAKVG